MTLTPVQFAYLVSRGLDPNATDEEAFKFSEDLKIRDEALKAERERASEIRSMCRDIGLNDEADRMINVGLSVEQARKELIDLYIKIRRRKGGYYMPATIVRDQRDKRRQAQTDGLALRMGSPIEKPAEGAEEMSGLSLAEHAREALIAAGENHLGNKMEVVGRAMMTSDLPNILANVANKELLRGFNEAPETFELWTDVGSVPDFKALELPRASELDDLDEIPERGKYEFGDMSDKKEMVQIVTFGKLFAITRQAIINDNTAVLQQIPYKMGIAAKRKIGDCAYSALTANAAMSDGITLFHANHGNIGTSGVLGITTVAEAIELMGLQTDLSGKAKLNLRPEYFIAPRALEGAAEVFFRSEKFDDTSAAATRVNPYAGKYFQRVYDARLDEVNPAKYYFAARKGLTVTVFYLNGEKEPYLEQRDGWKSDGVEFKVRIDAAAKAVDHVGMVSNAGGA